MILFDASTWHGYRPPNGDDPTNSDFSTFISVPQSLPLASFVETRFHTLRNAPTPSLASAGHFCGGGGASLQ